ncbi:hypothetical protein BDQ17DRAFT_378232 [Cyathus striatus]|nr:hypothetical protein BDQ17DRAFT_378232 [Cyathus striatus]
MDSLLFAFMQLALLPDYLGEDEVDDLDKAENNSTDLRNQNFFPPFLGLPGEHEFRPGWHMRNIFSGLCRPRKHWCFLAEITGRQFWPIRPMYMVRDIEGDEWLVAFHLDDRSQFPVIEQTYKAGYTIAVMYAEGHIFFDGNVGLRIEHMDAVRVLPCSLDALMETGSSINEPNVNCPACSKPAHLRCAQCKLSYCGRECQVRDWKLKHKNQCIVRKQILKWGMFDWSRFDRFRGFDKL